MRILHIHTSLDNGGIETFVSSLANEQVAMGHMVAVCSIFLPTEKAICWNRLHPNIKRVTFSKTEEGFSLKEPWMVYKLIRSQSPEVVHVHGFIAYYLLSIFILHRRIRFVYTLHSDAHYEGGVWDQRLRIIKKLFFRRQWIIPVTISHESERSFKEVYGFDTHIIYNGIHFPEKPEGEPERDANLFFHAGRISREKNQETLCKVFSRLEQEGKDVRLYIAGSIQDQTIYEQIVPYFGDRIQYIGLQSNIPNFMHRAGAMCLPSLYEGMPLVLLEALSSGCIPICTRVGGIKDIITDGYNGILCDEPTLEDFTESVNRYIHMGEQVRGLMRQHCIETAQRFTIHHCALEYSQLYHTEKP